MSATPISREMLCHALCALPLFFFLSPPPSLPTSLSFEADTDTDTDTGTGTYGDWIPYLLHSWNGDVLLFKASLKKSWKQSKEWNATPLPKKNKMLENYVFIMMSKKGVTYHNSLIENWIRKLIWKGVAMFFWHIWKWPMSRLRMCVVNFFPSLLNWLMAAIFRQIISSFFWVTPLVNIMTWEIIKDINDFARIQRLRYHWLRNE